MQRFVIRYLGDVQRLQLQDGDILVLSSQQYLSREACERLRDQMQAVMPGREVLILSGDMKIGVLSK